MDAEIEEILRQLHELRNYLGPVELLLANMETQIKKNRADVERRLGELELRLEELVNQTNSRTAQLPETSPSPTRLAPDGSPPNANV